MFIHQMVLSILVVVQLPYYAIVLVKEFTKSMELAGKQILSAHLALIQ
jgi:hypothetical protein